MGREFELKYRADGKKLEAIREKYGEFDTVRMETVYYDTADNALSLRHWTLRRRLENSRSVCTLKTPGTGNTRNEWEVEADDIGAAIPLLRAAGAPEELLILTKDGLVPTCGAKFTRLAKRLTAGGCSLELALDRGYLTGGGKVLPLCEVEAELKSGSEVAAVVFAAELAGEFSLAPEPASKFKRALSLTK